MCIFWFSSELLHTLHCHFVLQKHFKPTNDHLNGRKDEETLCHTRILCWYSFDVSIQQTMYSLDVKALLIICKFEKHDFIHMRSTNLNTFKKCDISYT